MSELCVRDLHATALPSVGIFKKICFTKALQTRYIKQPQLHADLMKLFQKFNKPVTGMLIVSSCHISKFRNSRCADNCDMLGTRNAGVRVVTLVPPYSRVQWQDTESLTVELMADARSGFAFLPMYSEIIGRISLLASKSMTFIFTIL
jgi:hypothetical protein